MTAIGYISDMEASVKPAWSLFQHGGAAAFKLSEGSPLPPALSAKELPREQTQVLNVCRIQQIDCHPAEIDTESAPESISDTENWLNWNGGLDNPNDSEDNCEADTASDADLDNCFEDPECPEQRDVCAAPNVPRLILPTPRSRKKTEIVLVTVNATVTRRIRGNRKCRTEWNHMCSAGSLCSLTENFT